MTEGGAGVGQQMRDIDNLQADNEMKTFAKMTGGMWFFPRFEGRCRRFSRTSTSDPIEVRTGLSPDESPSRTARYRKLRVELVDDEGKPLRFQDEKHKPLKYDIIARDGYRAKQEVE